MFRRSPVVVLGLVLALAPAVAEDAKTRAFSDRMTEPQAAVSPEGGVFIVAAHEGVIAVASSSDGTAFGRASRVTKLEGLALGMRSGPRIAATSRSVVVAAVGVNEGHGEQLLAWRSADQGSTWSAPTRLNTAVGSAGEGLIGIGAGPGEEIAVAWLEVRKRAPEVYVAVSLDGGASWSEALVYRSPDGHVCECCHPSVAWSVKGELAVMWRNWLHGSRDMWCSISKDRGKTFEAAKKIGSGSWKINQCPADGGALVFQGGAADVSASWAREGKIFTGSTDGTEKQIGAGMQPWTARGPSGLVSVWLAQRGGALRALVPGAEKAKTIAAEADDPVVASDVNGRGPVVVTWTSPSKEVFVQVLSKRE